MVRERDAGPSPTGYAAVVLAGGAGRRLGGATKPATPVGGRPMIERVLAAVADAAPRVVVGPPELTVPVGVLTTREEPPGGGPVAAAAAGLALVPADVDEVALLAGDLPLLTPPAVAALRRALNEGAAADEARRTGAGDVGDAELGGGGAGSGDGGAGSGGAGPGGGTRMDGVVYLDGSGRRQTLCGLWRAGPLRAALGRLAAARGSLTGVAMGALVVELTVVGVSWAGGGPPPWFDCDTDADLRRAEEWAR